MPLEGANQESSAIVYVWIGANSDAECTRLIEQIAEEKFNNPWVSLQVICRFTLTANKAKLDTWPLETEELPELTEFHKILSKLINLYILKKLKVSGANQLKLII